MSFNVFAANEDFQNGICLAYTQYLNKMDTPTIRNSKFNQKFQPRLNNSINAIGSCMKGKVDSPQQVKVCAQSSLSKADYDFIEGWNLGFKGIEASEPNMNEIKSKFRTSCNTIVL
jgi:hypothetical protein